jgi:zinc protease
MSLQERSAMSHARLIRALLAATSLALATRLTAAPLAAQQAVQKPDSLARPLPVDSAVRIGTLPNGLRYYIRVNHRPADRAELRLAVDAGSILENPDERGIAHFVEHMAFNGTRHFAKNDLVSYLESIGMRFGADLNAFTSFDETVYQLTVPTDSAKMLHKAFQILQDWADGQVFDSTQVDAERGVILEEWRLGQGAAARIRDRQLPVLFHGSRYAERLPIGDTAVIRHVQPAALAAFYHRWYRPDLMAIVAVGDFDPDTIDHLIRANFTTIPARTQPPRPVYDVPRQDSALVSVVTDPEATGTIVDVYDTHLSESDSTLHDFRRDIVEGLYDAMMNQRLDELTQKPDPPFIAAFAGNTGLARTEDAYVMAARVDEAGVLRGLGALLTESRRVQLQGFSATELERAKADALRGMESAYAERDKTESADYAEEYVDNFLEHDPIPGVAEEYALYRRFLPGITVQQVDSVAGRWVDPENRVILLSAPDSARTVLPDRGQLLAVFDSVDKAQVSAYTDVASTAPLVPDPPVPGAIAAERRIDTLGVTVWTLSNGARVVLKPTDFKADEVQMRAFAPGGTSLAPDSEFVAATTAAAVVAAGGAGGLSRIELDKALAGKEVSVSPYVGGLQEGLIGSGSPRDLETLFQLMYLYFIRPRSDTSAFQALQDRFSTLVENRSRSPQAAFQDTIQLVLSQHNPRALPVTTAWVKRMDLRSSLAFYRQRFADAGNFTFVFVGHFAVDSIRPLVRRWIASLPSVGPGERWRDLGIRPPPGVVHRAVHQGAEPRSETRIVFHGPMQYSDAEVYRLSALGDVLSLRLRNVLREELSGTYNVGVDASAAREPVQSYSVTIDFSAAPDRIDSLSDVVFNQIAALQRTGPTAAELEKVKETQLREREVALRQNGFWIEALSGWARYGGDPAAILTYDRRVEALDVASLRDVARRYLDPHRYVQVSLYPR